jgi:hypothetical protein
MKTGNKLVPGFDGRGIVQREGLGVHPFRKPFFSWMHYIHYAFSIGLIYPTARRYASEVNFETTTLTEDALYLYY